MQSDAESLGEYQCKVNKYYAKKLKDIRKIELRHYANWLKLMTNPTEMQREFIMKAEAYLKETHWQSLREKKRTARNKKLWGIDGKEADSESSTECRVPDGDEPAPDVG